MMFFALQYFSLTCNYASLRVGRIPIERQDYLTINFKNESNICNIFFNSIDSSSPIIPQTCEIRPIQGEIIENFVFDKSENSIFLNSSNVFYAYIYNCSTPGYPSSDPKNVVSIKWYTSNIVPTKTIIIDFRLKKLSMFLFLISAGTLFVYLLTFTQNLRNLCKIHFSILFLLLINTAIPLFLFLRYYFGSYLRVAFIFSFISIVILPPVRTAALFVLSIFMVVGSEQMDWIEFIVSLVIGLIVSGMQIEANIGKFYTKHDSETPYLALMLIFLISTFIQSRKIDFQVESKFEQKVIQCWVPILICTVLDILQIILMNYSITFGIYALFSSLTCLIISVVSFILRPNKVELK